MKKCKFAKLCTLSLGLVLSYTPVTPSQTIISPIQQQTVNPRSVLRALSRANVVYLGEAHNSPADHDAQMQIIRVLYQQSHRIAIAMEMFQRPYQRYIDLYLADRISERELFKETDFHDRWGFPWEYYAPFLRFAKTNRLPVIALNAPTEVVRKVARNGLESLSREEKKYIPSLADIHTDNQAYRQMLQEIYAQSHQDKSNSTSFDRFFQAQVVWDETMAETIAQFLQANPDYQVVVLAGQGHIMYNYGIPSRVARRLNSNLVQRTVLINPSDELQSQTLPPAADFFWNTGDR